MTVVIITDIFGLCASTDALMSFLKSYGVESIFVDPYQGRRQDFAYEEQAYSAFIKQCGHDNFFDLAKESLLKRKPELVIGFSAGATVVWRLSNLEIFNAKQMLCFYPSRIRNYLDITPKTFVDIIFPSSEKSFDVNALREEVVLLSNVTAEITVYPHGFMNPSSKAYDIDGEKHGFRVIKRHLKALSALNSNI